MAEPVLMQQSRVKVSEVDDRQRLRPVTEAGVESLIASITETGVMKDAIHVRKKKGGSLVLIAGGHRLEAARRLGWDEIEAKVWTGVTDDWARLMEIDDNLAGAEMNALDTAVFLATRKAVYERLHPETRAATGAALAARRWDAAELSSTASFATATAEKFGITARQVRKIVAAGAALAPDQVRALRRAPHPVRLVDLQVIAKVDPATRYEVVDRLAAGQATTAAKALRQVKADAGLIPPPLARSDELYMAIKRAWMRADITARRRFVDEVFEELSPLVVDEAERRDAAEIGSLRQRMGVAAE